MSGRESVLDEPLIETLNEPPVGNEAWPQTCPNPDAVVLGGKPPSFMPPRATARHPNVLREGDPSPGPIVHVKMLTSLRRGRYGARITCTVILSVLGIICFRSRLRSVNYAQIAPPATMGFQRALAMLEHFDTDAKSARVMKCGDINITVQYQGDGFGSSTNKICDARYGCYFVQTKVWEEAQMSEIESYPDDAGTVKERDQRSASLGLRNVFNSFAAIPTGSYNCVEIAPGPYTRWSVIHGFRSDISCHRMTAVDPLLDVWKRNPSSPFYEGNSLPGTDTLTTIALPLFRTRLK